VDVDVLWRELERIARLLRDVADIPHNESTVTEVAHKLDELSWELLLDDLKAPG
jgi:hypothetical protein